MNILYIIAYTAFFSFLSFWGGNNRVVEASTGINTVSINRTAPSAGVARQAIAASLLEPGIAEWVVKDTLPEVSLPEFVGTEIKLYEANGYSVYSIGKDLLFSTGSTGFKTGAEQSLKKISSAITQRNKEGQIRIYAYTEVSDNPNFNRDIAERRAQAVKEWLQKEGNVAGDRIVVQPIIEVSSESPTDSRRQKDRRIEIVVRKTMP